MGGLFGKESSAPKKTTGKANETRKAPPQLSVKDQAVLDLKRARDRLDKARKKAEIEQSTYVDKAKGFLKEGKKDKAKYALRLKKMKEVQLEKVTAQLANLEQMVNDVEWAHHQVEIVEGMKAGNLALKELQLDPDEVADIVAETQEAMARKQEIDDLLSGTLSTEDEDDVLAELDKIELEEAAHLEFDLPNAPANTVEHGNAVNTTEEPVAEERQPVLA